MPSSSARCSQLPRAVDKVPFYIALKKLRDHLRGDLPELGESEVIFPDLDLKVELKQGPVKVKQESKHDPADKDSPESKSRLSMKRKGRTVVNGVVKSDACPIKTDLVVDVRTDGQMEPSSATYVPSSSSCQSLPYIFPPRSFFAGIPTISSFQPSTTMPDGVATSLGVVEPDVQTVKEEVALDLSQYGSMPSTLSSMSNGTSYR